MSDQLIVQAAVSELNKKLKLERPLLRTLKSFLQDMLDQYVDYYKTVNLKLDLSKLRPDLTQIFLNHYDKVKKEFLGNSIINLRQKTFFSYRKESKLFDDVDVNKVVEETIDSYFLVLAPNQARIVLNTAQSDLDSLIAKYVQDSIENGKEPDPDVIIELVKTDYESKIPGKANVISISETQYASELVKQAEAEEAVRADPTSDLMYKQWSAILDRRVRPWHAEADGQRVAINEPFIVKGEKLMHPGDTSFGVSPDNVINCRCSSIIVKP
jgi:hypothetical protein